MIHPNCNHVCSGNCRRVGCSCLCGEWHDTQADDRQRLHIQVIFNTRHNPGSVLHLREVLKSYLAGKGIELHDDLSVEV